MWAGKRSQLLLPLWLWLLLLSRPQLPVAAAGGHVVTRMRGFDGPLPFYLETGYVEVDERHGVHLFYYFARSEKDPDEDPLLLWLSGGPGCSGISGLAYEIGPFQFDAQGYTGGFPNLRYRPETWTKGYIVGNPVTDKQYDTDGQIPYLHGMGLVSYELYKNARENCGGKYSVPCNAVCAEAVQAIYNCTRDINQHHILEPACPDELWSPETNKMSRLMLESTDFLSGFKCKQAAYFLSYIWGNDETIQESLGVRKGTIGAWKRANRELPYTYDIQSALEYNSSLATKGYAALIYSGDHDPGITSVGTQAWIGYLNLTIVDDWRPWYVGGQVAGYTRSYSSNLTFATVKGAGHTAPEYNPLECQSMFVRWISHDPL